MFIPQKIKFFFLIAIFILLGLTILSYFRIKNLSESAILVNHTRTVEITLEKIYTNILELEANHKGFILSRDEKFSKNLPIGRLELEKNLNLLQILIRDNQIQTNNLLNIRKLILIYRKYFQKITDQSAVSLVTPKNWVESKILSDNLKNKIREMQVEEEKLSIKRTSVFNKAIFLTPLFSIILVFVSIITLFGAYLKIIKDLNTSEKLKEKFEMQTVEFAESNEKLAIQNIEIKKRAADFLLANSELAFQNDEKEKRAAELFIANKELAFQNEEKEKRAAELIIANEELAFQNDEKEQRAIELKIANNELAFQNDEKEKRASELIIANKELAFQNEEKEKRATELTAANKELDAFVYISSHDLQEPLRKIQIFGGRILEKEMAVLSETGKDYFNRMIDAANRMQTLIEDLLSFSRLNTAERKFEETDLSIIIEDVKLELKETINEKQALIETEGLCMVKIIPFQFRQLMVNLLSNSLKFSNPNKTPIIRISSKIVKNIPELDNSLLQKKDFCLISIIDNGIGFEPEYKNKIFEVFQRLHGKEVYSGTGIGLAIVKKIIENHEGFIYAKGVLGEGAQFDIYLPE